MEKKILVIKIFYFYNYFLSFYFKRKKIMDKSKIYTLAIIIILTLAYVLRTKKQSPIQPAKIDTAVTHPASVCKLK
jgi:hypothetical protein